MTRFFGKYEGKVKQNFDPEQIGRIQVSVPAVLGDNMLAWARPCVPYAGVQAGLYAIPPIEANVWVEFMGGDPQFPIWTGCFWIKGETPTLALAPPLPVQHILLQTTLQNMIHLNDSPDPALGGITIQSGTGGMITINARGITISNGQGATIQMTGTAVSINGASLVVTQ